MPKGVYVRSEATKAALRENARKSGGFRGPHSPETKAKMRAAKLARPTMYWLGKKRGPHSPETRAKMSAGAQSSVPAHVRAMANDARRGTHHTPESIAKIKAALARPEAKAAMRASVLGKPCRHSKHPHYYNGQRFRSSYEVRVAAALDALGVRWSYEPKRFDCGVFTYAPDFYLVDDDAYWEVKGWYGPDSQRKVETFRFLYPQITLVLFTKACLDALEAAVSSRAA